MTFEPSRDCIQEITQRLVRRAARRAPGALSARLEEEWLADLATQRGSIARLRFALGCCWATNVIAHEHTVAAVPAASSPVGQGPLLRYARDDIPFFTGRTVTFVAIASLHAAILYGVVMELGPRFTKIVAVPFVSHMIDRPPRELPPPPPRPELFPSRIVAPPAQIMPPIEAEGTDAIVETPPEPPRHLSPPATPAAVTRVQGGPGTGFPSTDSFYPDASLRMGESGVVTVQACVDPRGRLISEPTIIESTGSRRLEEGALRLAKAGSGHYRATTEDGRPVNSCYPFRIRFELLR